MDERPGTARPHGRARRSRRASRCSPSWDQLVMMPAEGAAGAGAAARHARAPHARARHRARRSAAGWTELDEATATRAARRARPRHRAHRAPRLGARAARARGARRRARPRERRRARRAGSAARANDDFAAFAPALQRNVELARAYGECLAEDGREPYEALLGDYDFGLRTDELRRVFGALAAAAAAARGSRRACTRRAATLAVPVGAQQAAVAGTLRRLGVERGELARGRLRAPLHRVDGPRATRA